MGSRRLPKGEALDKLAREYRECPPDKIAEFCEARAKQYSFASAGSFMSSMSKTVGVRREPIMVYPEAKPEVHTISSHIECVKKLKTASDRMQTAAFLFDPHNPFHDRKTMIAVDSFLEELQPDYLMYGGDAQDFYLISKFDKNPQRGGKLQEDIDSTTAMFQRHRKILPNAVMYEIEGNHEDRLRRFLWSGAPQLESLRCLQLEKLLRLEEYEINHVSYEEGLMINDIFLAIHGDIASIHSGYTAKRMREKHGGNGICGHCHKGGSSYKRDRFGIWGWWEGFCLCDLNPDWIKNPNWMQGISLVHFKGKRFWVEQMPIIEHAFMYGGKLYG